VSKTTAAGVASLWSAQWLGTAVHVGSKACVVVPKKGHGPRTDCRKRRWQAGYSAGCANVPLVRSPPRSVICVKAIQIGHWIVAAHDDEAHVPVTFSPADTSFPASLFRQFARSIARASVALTSNIPSSRVSDPPHPQTRRRRSPSATAILLTPTSNFAVIAAFCPSDFSSPTLDNDYRLRQPRRLVASPCPVALRHVSSRNRRCRCSGGAHAAPLCDSLDGIAKHFAIRNIFTAGNLGDRAFEHVVTTLIRQENEHPKAPVQLFKAFGSSERRSVFSRSQSADFATKSALPFPSATRNGRSSYREMTSSNPGNVAGYRPVA